LANISFFNIFIYSYFFKLREVILFNDFKVNLSFQFFPIKC
jgi:hypothetical protein